jgi:hypothetical protein
MAENLVEAWLEVQQYGGPVEARHHCLERIVLIQEAVLVRTDDPVGR